MSDSIVDRLTEDLKDAMRNKDKVRRRTLRSLRSALKNKEIDQREEGAETALSEQEQLAVLRKQVNQRKDAIEQYEDAGREDLVEREQAELDVLDEYMPDALSDDELEEILQAIIDDVGAESMADMGAVMGRAMDRLKGRVDGGRVQETVQILLQS
ncbi:MAG: glutamyl-tRNA amidotransferase [Bacteroidetes bacterium SW_9_63_38]|nr:MAG: glutamyl-tRNA amidotransferase [Bacteroidetes bacterium SW_9_63_38]